MKELSTYIIEKLSIDDVTLVNDKLPNKIDFKSIASYLMKNGFTEINGYADIRSLKTAFNKAHGRALTLDSHTLVIRFANTSGGNISYENPIYACKFYNKAGGATTKPVYATEVKDWWEIRFDEKDFIEEIKKIVE